MEANRDLNASSNTAAWPVARADGERLKRLNLQVIGPMHRAGVRLLAGTDGPLGEAGKLHDELVMLVGAGLSPLQAATLYAAEFVGRAADLGTIECGKIADLVVLNANPIADIHNTRCVQAVVLNGRFLSARAHERALRRDEAQAQVLGSA